MRVLFWGTPRFAVPTLLALGEEGHDVVGVVTQPDRPAGRGRRTRSSQVKEVALEDGLRVLEPEQPRGDAFVEEIRELQPDVSVVVAYGHILRRDVLDVPGHGSINVHASLLPELRGAAPVHWAIVGGYERTGVTVMRMVEAMDAGPILRQMEEPIGEQETASELSIRLSEIGAEVLVEALALLSLGQLTERAQEEARVTYAPKVDRSGARIDWSLDATAVCNLIRGMDESPGAWTSLRGETLKMFRPLQSQDLLGEDPGAVLRADAREGLVVAAGRDAVQVGEVQPAGRRRMRATDWIAGRGVSEGDRLL